jgi:WhiB family transcriptional regulator, redox-sensing transcriptional regulator
LSVIFDLGKLRRRAEAHRLRANGFSNEEIGVELGMNTRDVRRYLRLPVPKLAVPPNRWWSDNAACSGMDVSVFYPTSRGKGTIALKRKAMMVCAGCPVRARCRETAEANYEQHGVWGGVDFSQYRYTYNEQTGDVEVRAKRGSDEPVAKVS